MWHDMQWHGWGHHMFSWWAVIIMGLLIIAAAFVIMRSDTDQQRRASASDTPLDILERRYARGEIDHEEFEEKKRDLQD